MPSTDSIFDFKSEPRLIPHTRPLPFVDAVSVFEGNIKHHTDYMAIYQITTQCLPQFWYSVTMSVAPLTPKPESVLTESNPPQISCPFAYIASTRIEALAERTSATLIWRPVLLGAIYRATSAPQGAAGSASDVFNPTKKAVTVRSMQRTLRRYQIEYNPPPQHPRKSVNALRLLHYVSTEDRPALSKALFRAYWVEGRDVTDSKELLKIAVESGVSNARNLDESVFADARARKGLEDATAEAISRGAFGVPGFWVPEEKWVDPSGKTQTGRYYWGQDRMHFVEAALLALSNGGNWNSITGLRSLIPRCMGSNRLPAKAKVEFWYDFSSPWAYLGWAQLQRLQRTFGEDLEVVMKPFLLGILFREYVSFCAPLAELFDKQMMDQLMSLELARPTSPWLLYPNRKQTGPARTTPIGSASGMP
jgi:2-hydroxychromene-2-carboxylate isomerase